MGKIKKKDAARYLWTARAEKLFASKSVIAGEPAQFNGEPLTGENVIKSWLARGYIEQEGARHG